MNLDNERAQESTNPTRALKSRLHYRKWHSNNREALNARRAARYKEDEDYRQRVLLSRKAYLARRPPKDPAPSVPEGYSSALGDVAERHSLHRTTPIRWMLAGDIPVIHKIGTTYYVTAKQEALLDTFFAQVSGRRRVFGSNDPAMQSAVSALWSDWKL